LNIEDNVQPKCKGRVNDDTLENAITLDLCLFNSRCVIKLRETLVRVLLALNLKFCTTYRSEALVLISVSWIGVV
jgi:hypothetical protein